MPFAHLGHISVLALPRLLIWEISLFLNVLCRLLMFVLSALCSHMSELLFFEGGLKRFASFTIQKLARPVRAAQRAGGWRLGLPSKNNAFIACENNPFIGANQSMCALLHQSEIRCLHFDVLWKSAPLSSRSLGFHKACVLLRRNDPFFSYEKKGSSLWSRSRTFIKATEERHSGAPFYELVKKGVHSCAVC